MNARHVAPAPEALAVRVGYADATKPAPEPANDAQLDTPAAIARAKRYLQEDAVPAIEGQGGDATTFKTICRLKDLGLSQDCTELLVSEHYNPRCQPPWAAEELGTKVKNAYVYGTSPPGVADLQKAFKPVAPEPTDAPRPRFAFQYAGLVKPQLDNQWLIHRVVPQNGIVVLASVPNRMKTFISIDALMCVARGCPWHDRDSEKRACVYFDADGDITNRVAGYMLENRLQAQDVPFAFAVGHLDLFGTADAQHVITALRDYSARAGLPVGLVCFDTLQGVLGGGDENSNKDMNALLVNLQKIKETIGCTILLLHHLGKDTSKGLRGHSGLEGKVDTVMLLNDQGVLTVTKQRGGSKGDQFGFELKQVVLGQDCKDRDVTTCVVRPMNAAAARAFTRQAPKPGSVNAKALVVLQDMTLNGDATRIAAWKDDFLSKHYPDNRKAGATAFDRARTALFRGGNITVEGDYAAPVE